MQLATSKSPEVRPLPARRHHEEHVELDAPADAVFDLLDDHGRLAEHMTRRTWMMAGSRMELRMDSAEGRAVGSRIGLSGRVLGIGLELEEIVVERDPPRRKSWETVRPPKLLVMGPYRMGFQVQPTGPASATLSVFIDYELPERGVGRILGHVLGRWYAMWCTRRMTSEAAATLGPYPLNLVVP